MELIRAMAMPFQAQSLLFALDPGARDHRGPQRRR